jgi:succinate dehydrogenase/fumarate reductase cytochrome b subunit
LTRAALTWTALTWAALSGSALSTLLSLLELGATLAWPAELLRLALLPWAALLAGAALTTLLPGLSSWSFVERLAALLGLSLTALLSARLAFVLLFAFVLGVFTLCNDQTAIRSADALKRDAQLWNRNRRH